MSNDYNYAATTEDKMMPIAAHALMLLSVPSAGVAALVAVVLAYAGRRDSDDLDWRESHYEFTIWTFWLSLAAFVLAWIMIFLGFPLILALGLGLIPIMIGGAILTLLGVWVVVRAALGLVYALKAEPYPRPHSLLV